MTERTGVPPRITPPERANMALAAGLTLFVAAASAILFVFNPAQHGFYPVCLFHKLTGWLCPGCGSLRALHQLLHGQVIEALRLNALLVLSLPALVWVGIRVLYELLGGTAKPVAIGRFWVLAGLAAVIAFGILRNICF